MVPSKIRTKQSTIAILHLYWKANTYCKLQPKSWQDTPYLSFQLADCHNRIFLYIYLVMHIMLPLKVNMWLYVHWFTVGAENMFPFRSELRWKTSFKVWGYFVRSSGLFRSKFGFTSNEIVHFVRTSAQLQTNFASTLNELRPNFKRTSSQLRLKFAKYELRMDT